MYWLFSWKSCRELFSCVGRNPELTSPFYVQTIDWALIQMFHPSYNRAISPIMGYITSCIMCHLKAHHIFHCPMIAMIDQSGQPLGQASKCCAYISADKWFPKPTEKWITPPPSVSGMWAYISENILTLDQIIALTVDEHCHAPAWTQTLWWCSPAVLAFPPQLACTCWGRREWMLPSAGGCCSRWRRLSFIHSVSKETQLFFMDFSWGPGSGSCDLGSWEICI